MQQATEERKEPVCNNGALEGALDAYGRMILTEFSEPSQAGIRDPQAAGDNVTKQSRGKSS